MAAFLALAAGSTGTGRAQTIQENLWVTDATVRAVALRNGTIYIGGDFSQVGPPTGNAVGIHDGTGSVTGIPRVAGTVRTIVADGAGGWYIGGDFTSVGGVPRNRIAHIRADHTVSPWNPNANSSVSALCLSGAIVYAGGSFSNIGGQVRAYIAALDAVTGNATPWNPNANSTVLALSVSGSTVYAGGSFSSIGGQPRVRIAALDAASGNATPWSPSASSTVRALLVSGSTVYAGGSFTHIGGQNRSRIAAIDAVTGGATSWNPSASGTVNALALSGSKVYAGGSFYSIGGQGRPSIAALDVATGSATSWNPNANSTVYTIALSGPNVYAGGSFTSIGGQTRNRIAALNSISGAATPWNPNAMGIVHSIAASSPTVYAGGEFQSVGGLARSRVAALDAATGNAISWAPTVNGTVNALSVSGSIVYLGGSFSSVAGLPRNRIAAVDALTGSVTPWNPNANNTVHALAGGGSTVYAGGLFTSIGGQARNRIAALDAVTGGAVVSWNPNANNAVYALAVHGSVVYAGGSFTSIGGQLRNRIAAIGPTGTAATFWDPSANNTVQALAVGPAVYAAGLFTAIGGQPRNRIAALDPAGGGATSWNANANNTVLALSMRGSTLYAGGTFSNIGGQVRNRIAALDALTGTASPWNPNANGSVVALWTGDASVYAAGGLTMIGGKPRPFFAGMTADGFDEVHHELTMVADPGGSVFPPSGSYSEGDAVVIRAVPNSGYLHTGWTGVGAGSYTGPQNPATIVIGGPITQTAHFQIAQQLPLTMVATEGGIVSPPSGTYDFLTEVPIQAVTTTLGWRFSHWLGTGIGSYTGPDSLATVVMADAITETGVFSWVGNHELTMTAFGQGAVLPGTGDYLHGSVLTIEAVPDSGWIFDYWGGSGQGAYLGTENPVDILILNDIEQTAVFARLVTVTVTTSPPSRTVYADGVPYVSPVSFEWAAGSGHTIAVDSLVTQGAGTRERFTAWSDGHPTASRGVYVLDSDMSFTAFYQLEHELTFQDPPEGTSLPGNGWHAVASTVSIEAIGDPGFRFTSWIGQGDGSYTGTDNPATVVMLGPVTETPSFQPFGFDFSISASDTDPFVNVSPPTGTARSLYFWVTCAEEGLSAFEGSVIGELPPIAFSPAPGVFNIGDADDLLLAVGSCPTGENVNFLLGSWIVIDGGGTLCLGPSATGNLGAVDCDEISPTFVPSPRIRGFSSSATPPCLIDEHPCSGSPLASRDQALSVAGMAPVPTKLTLVRPNPFSRSTEVWFQLGRDARASLLVYDVAGRLVRRILDGSQSPGSHGVRWDGTDARGRAVPSGAYFLRFEADGVEETRKLVLIR